MTKEQILDLKQKIRELDAKASKGPWKADVVHHPYVWSSDEQTLIAKTWNDDKKAQVANRDFIAFAREALPTLLAYCEELEGQLRKANTTIDELNQAFIDENF